LALRNTVSVPRIRDWAKKLEAKPKYVVSTTRRDFPWSNTHLVEGDLTRAVRALKKATPHGLLVGSPKLSAALQRLDLLDEYRIVVHPVVAGHGPYLFSGLKPLARLKLVAAKRLESGIVALHYRRPWRLVGQLLDAAVLGAPGAAPAVVHPCRCASRAT